MSAFKQFLASDVIVTPFEVSKWFDLPYSLWETGSDNQLTGLDRFLGVSGLFETNQDTTGTISSEYQVLVYNSIKELYYSNYITSSWGDSIFTSSIFPGETTEGDILVGPTSSQGRYENYLQTTLTQSRYFPTGSDAKLAVLSIPSKLFGEKIQPNTFTLSLVDTYNNRYIATDDGEGNIVIDNSFVGNIFYAHGIVTFTALSDNPLPAPDGYGVAIYGLSVYGGGLTTDDIVNATNVTCSFSSSYNIYETQYKATLRESEFNFSLNPSIISGSTDGTIYNFATSSEFSPYVTTVGLYNENQELLAIGKLAQPLPTSPSTDTSILINIDR